MKRLDQLTSTRFWALLLVLIYHGGANLYIGWATGITPIAALLFSAPTAVSYLYVLSGFVMPLVYYRPNEKFDMPGYWSARFVRIYPLYIIAFLLTCYFYLDYMPRIEPQKVMANVFVLQAWWPAYAQSFNYASWSITVEFFFYAIFPFFTLWAYRQSTRKLIWSSLTLWIVTQVIYFILWKGFFPAWEYFLVYNPIFHLSSFVMGVVGGIWYMREAGRGQVNQKLNLTLIIVSFVLFCGYTILSAYFPELPHRLQPMAGLLVPFFIVFIVALALDRTRLSTFLSQRWLVTLGETSFALYILHVPVIWIYERWLFTSGLADPQFILNVTYLPLMISIGLIAYLWIDPPLRKWMKNTLQRVSMPLLVLDLAIFAISTYLSFKLRFGDGRDFRSYLNTMLLVFWGAVLFRTSSSIFFNALNPAILHGSMRDLVRPVLLSVTTGSVIVLFLIYLTQALGWIDNVPRSALLIDWVVVLLLSLLIRFSFRGLGLYRMQVASA
jgi:peptidoglycan/LPS O-acetylase OafA/YrhL